MIDNRTAQMGKVVGTADTVAQANKELVAVLGEVKSEAERWRLAAAIYQYADAIYRHGWEQATLASLNKA